MYQRLANLMECHNEFKKLSQCGFWNSSQASFLKQVKDEDADWAEIVDQLNAMLR